MRRYARERARARASPERMWPALAARRQGRQGGGAFGRARQSQPRCLRYTGAPTNRRAQRNVGAHIKSLGSLCKACKPEISYSTSLEMSRACLMRLFYHPHCSVVIFRFSHIRRHFDNACSDHNYYDSHKKAAFLLYKHDVIQVVANLTIMNDKDIASAQSILFPPRLLADFAVWEKYKVFIVFYVDEIA
ncbi:uncharacterized protein LOC133925831 isoform X2 [Phragmites australis]|uniref:uncharacterized protein LOC133925831 isoform X2 n=1 Tax=Phragmites australis TaxID=29695 RepID=UPI002D78B24F|nr:uncharacterized protein LOC133925831 isoform X2 [Phragmites australis]